MCSLVDRARATYDEADQSWAVNGLTGEAQIISLPFDGSCSQARGRSVWKREAREEQAGEGDGASSVRGYPGDLSNHKAPAKAGAHSPHAGSRQN
jgi:hypothetical protein